MLEAGFGTHLLMITKLFNEMFGTTGYVVPQGTRLLSFS
jgi:hypothetical protein